MENQIQIVLDTNAKPEISRLGLNFNPEQRMWFKLFQIVSAGYWIDAIHEDVVVMHKIKK